MQSFRHPEPEVAPTCWRFRAKDDVTSTWPSYVRSVHSIAQRQVSLVTSDYVLVWGNMNEVSCWFLCFKCSTNVFFALYGQDGFYVGELQDGRKVKTWWNSTGRSFSAFLGRTIRRISGPASTRPTNWCRIRRNTNNRYIIRH